MNTWEIDRDKDRGRERKGYTLGTQQALIKFILPGNMYREAY